LLKNFVLIGKDLGRESHLVITVTDLLEFLLGKLEDFGFSLYLDVDVHDVLHEEGTLIDNRTCVEGFESEVILFKVSVYINHTVFKENKSLRGLVFYEYSLFFFKVAGGQAENDVK
jgi:hypothetical protein